MNATRFEKGLFHRALKSIPTFCGIVVTLIVLHMTLEWSTPWAEAHGIEPPHKVTGIQMMPDRQIQIEGTGPTQKYYDLQTSTNLLNWATEQSGYFAQSNFNFATPSQVKRAFYRVAMRPGTNQPIWQASSGISFQVGTGRVITLRWPGATGSRPILRYAIYHCGSLLTNVEPGDREIEIGGLATNQIHEFSVVAINDNADWSEVPLSGSINPSPRDPSGVAPAPEPGVVSLLSDSTDFLFTGPNAIQTGVKAGTIDPLRQSVLFGQVLDNSGQPIECAVVSIENHPEYGVTVTRADGRFNLVVNGGGFLIANFDRGGYLPSQRNVNVPKLRHVPVEDVVLLVADGSRPVLDTAGPPAMQVAQGAAVSDSSGTRRATLMIPPGVQAYLITEAGATQAVDSLAMHFTEYSTGSNGPCAMPGVLPPTSGYTYCLELGSEEALASIGCKGVIFSTQVFSYVENFIGMPAGTKVPVGRYDSERGVWIPSPDGLVIRLMGTNAFGLAQIDANGDGSADGDVALQTLGFTPEERLSLVQTYSATQSLWRVPLTHFSPVDYNHTILPPADATTPKLPKISTKESKPVKKPNTTSGYGQIEVERQVFQETIPVYGTPCSLRYSSARMPGYSGTHRVDIPLSGSTIPASLKRIELQISVAGRKFSSSFSPQTNLVYPFVWDGKDDCGRTLQGKQKINVGVGYVYDGYYEIPPSARASWGLPSGVAIPNMIPARQEVVLWQDREATVGNFMLVGLGGWTLSAHHSYDPVAKTLYLGDGTVQQIEQTSGDFVISTVAGIGSPGFSGDGGPATLASLNGPGSIAFGADGSLYIADGGNCRVRCVRPDGTIVTVAGNGSSTFSGDGGPATGAGGSFGCVTVGPDGSVYTGGDGRVRRIDPAGIITTVAGNGLGSQTGASGDEGPATDAGIAPWELAVSPYGFLYIGEWCGSSGRIRCVGADGIIHTVAGRRDGYWSRFAYDGGPATNAIFALYGMDVSPAGRIYLADGNYDDVPHNSIRVIGTDGIINRLAGYAWMGVGGGFSGDGGSALNARMYPSDIALAPDGGYYVAEADNHCIRYVGPDGIIRTVAGRPPSGYGDSGDGGPSSAALMNRPWSISMGPDDAVYFADPASHRVRRIGRAMPGVTNGNIQIASEDGSLLFEFDRKGRHLRTLNANTGATVLTFEYTRGYLTRVTDGDGNAIRIERNGDDVPTAIVAPHGQRTTLALNGDGYLETATDPGGGTTRLGYQSDKGLLTSITGPRGYTYTVGYDGDGYVARAADPAGGFTDFYRYLWSDGLEVDQVTSMGRVSAVGLDDDPDGSRFRYQVPADGSWEATTNAIDGSEITRDAYGVRTTVQMAPDPRFGMQVAIPQQTVIRMPSGLTVTSSVTRSTVMDGSNMVSLTDTSTVNGNAWIGVYTTSNRSIVATSPEGRTSTIWTDAMGRVVRHEVPDLEPEVYSYDAQGRLIVKSQGTGGTTRSYTCEYDAQGFLGSTTDPLERTWHFSRDARGCITNTTLPDGRQVGQCVDAEGNITSFTPSGRAAHTFSLSPIGSCIAYIPPAGGGTTNATFFERNSDHQLTTVRWEDGSSVTNAYDDGGRLSGVLMPGGEQYTFSYFDNGLPATDSSPCGISVSRQYDGGLVTALCWSGAVTGTVSAAFNNDLLLTQQTVNGANPIVYHYDRDGLMVAAGECAYSRDPRNGALMGKSCGQVQDSYAYNGFGEVTDYEALYNGAELFRCSYAYDKLGRIKQKTEVVQGTACVFDYSYDLAGRLTEVRTNGALARSYGYDANGNRAYCTQAGSSLLGTYDGQDRMLSYGAATYSYNARGDVTNKAAGDQSTAYTYDAAGALRRVSLSSGAQIEYLTDGFGRRVAKRVNGTIATAFLYGDPRTPVAELDGANNVVSVFAHGGGPTPDYMVRGGIVYRILSDHLGSPHLVVNSQTGAIAQRMVYDEFGRVILDTNPGFQPFGFAGGLYDPDTGLVEFGVRQYEAESSRWMAADPAGFSIADANRYVYAQNDPVNLVDPSGFGPSSGGERTRALDANWANPGALGPRRVKWDGDPGAEILARHEQRLSGKGSQEPFSSVPNLSTERLLPEQVILIDKEEEVITKLLTIIRDSEEDTEWTPELINKKSQLFNFVSNYLKVSHETKMNVVHNLP